MVVDHIGYAVKNIEKARPAFEALGYQFEELIEDTDRRIWIQFGVNGSCRIELVAPTGEGESPVDDILKKMGATPYHICYKTADLAQGIKALEAQKYKVIVPAAKAVAFGGKRVVFLMHRSLGMIELVEE